MSENSILKIVQNLDWLSIPTFPCKPLQLKYRQIIHWNQRLTCYHSIICSGWWPCPGTWWPRTWRSTHRRHRHALLKLFGGAGAALLTFGSAAMPCCLLSRVCQKSLHCIGSEIMLGLTYFAIHTISLRKKIGLYTDTPL